MTVSTPIAWTELTSRHRPERLTVSTVPKRLERSDPWPEMEHSSQTITEALLRKVMSERV